MTELNGVLPVDKPEGPTSHDAVAVARRAVGMRRIGHTGTLDPFASGLLLLCLGTSTRLAEYLTALPKQYFATLHLGVATDTDDLTGQTLRVSDAWTELSREAVEAALESQVGDILQVPPAYSAKKVDGERMYSLARRGAPVQREPAPVTIHAIRVVRFALPEVDLEVDCGSGTYIRAIARDVGEALGVGAHLTRLRRTRIGSHGVEQAISFDGLTDSEAVANALLSPAQALGHLLKLEVDGEEATALLNGRPLAARDGVPEGTPLLLVSGPGDLLAIGELALGMIRPRKVFA